MALHIRYIDVEGSRCDTPAPAWMNEAVGTPEGQQRIEAFIEGMVFCGGARSARVYRHREETVTVVKLVEEVLFQQLGD